MQNFIASWRPSINDVGNWKGGGVKNWSKLPMDSIKKTADRGRGFQKSGKIADVVYGWSSAYNDFFLLLLVGMPRACSRLACVCM